MPILAVLIALQATALPAPAPAPVPQAPVARPPAAGPPAPLDRPFGPLLAPAPSRRAIVLAAVRAEWPSYDAGAKGRLTPLEFSTWVLRSHGLRVAPMGAAGLGIPATRAIAATAAAFALADANHDGGVTQEEMTEFLVR